MRSTSINLAMPKSSNRTWPSAVTRMLPGLRSRCTTSRACACATAAATWSSSPSRSRDRQRSLMAVHVNGLAVDVLHREVGPALSVDAGVVQARDVRMLE